MFFKWPSLSLRVLVSDGRDGLEVQVVDGRVGHEVHGGGNDRVSHRVLVSVGLASRQVLHGARRPC